MARWLVILICLAVAAWSGYWWVGSGAQQRALTAWLEDRAGDGWVAEYDSLRVRGYPNRFDTRLTGVTLADPRSGWAWSAPVFQVLALSYQPNHVIAVWPPEQKVSSLQETISVTSDDMRASVRFEPNTALALSALTMDMKAVKMLSTDGWTASMKAAQLATRQTAGVAYSHDLHFKAEEMKPARILRGIVDPEGRLPEVFDAVRLDSTIAFDSAWDRFAIEGRKPEITAIEIKDFTARWGELEFQAKGALRVDRAGVPTGDVAVRAKNWQEMLAVGVASGLIPAQLEPSLQSGLGLLARLSGNPDTIDAPLSFAGGKVKLGPVPIGDAPIIRINP